MLISVYKHKTKCYSTQKGEKTMSEKNGTETLVRSDQKQEAEAVAKVLMNLSEKKRVDLENFLKAVDFLEQRNSKTA